MGGGEDPSATIAVPRWLALLIAAAVVWILAADSIADLFWTPVQVRALLRWRAEMPDAEDVNELEARLKKLETELLLQHERYIDLLNRRSD